MAIESATYISELNAAYPAETEAVADGDEHFRLLKSTVKNTFPGRTAPEGAYLGISGSSVNLVGDDRGKVIELLQATSLTLPKLGTDFSAYSYLVHAVLTCSVAGVGGDLVNGVASLNMVAGTQYRILGSSSTGWRVLRVGGEFVTGTRMPFAQASAPVGWTQDTSDNANNRMLRVVNSAGGGVAGTHSPILNNVVPSHTHGMTTGGASADHSHSGTTGNVSADHTHGFGSHAHGINTPYGGSGGAQWGISPVYQAGALNVMNTESGGAGNTGGISSNHTHSFGTGGASVGHTHSGTTDNGSSQTNWVPRSIDMIICAKA